MNLIMIARYSTHSDVVTVWIWKEVVAVSVYDPTEGNVRNIAMQSYYDKLRS